MDDNFSAACKLDFDVRQSGLVPAAQMCNQMHIRALPAQLASLQL
jgi:hypothetical protein